ncbi:MAG: DUF3299 domain-containing protein [Spirochaetales bacterium]|nr:DUF3299 domain-containing protein [Spirochaetales bacterium]
MKIKLTLLLPFLLLIPCGANGQVEINPDDYRLIEWMDLLSPGEIQYYAEVQEGIDGDPEFIHPDPVPPADVDPALDGTKIRMAGFMVGVDSDPKNFAKVRSFLFVPWQGACIHVPPPPANQIIYVESEKALDSNPYEAFMLYGTISVKKGSNEQAPYCYTLEMDFIELIER